jgi:HD-GYP domain-containing protein (c-di-GMP phosphodiesterase class II)
MSLLEPIDRFEDRMKGFPVEDLVFARDASGAAHRLMIQNKGESFLASPDKADRWLRAEDVAKPDFLKKVRGQLEKLLQADLGNHILFRHLRPKEVTPMAAEALYWDIQLPEGGMDLDPKAARGIIENYQALHNLPMPEARRYPIILEGYSLGHATRVAIYSALLAQKMKSNDPSPATASIAGFYHDLGKLQPMISALIRTSRRLNEAEYETVKLHPIVGAVDWIEMNQKMAPLVSNIETQYSVFLGILEHHLRPDKRGYPYFLRNERLSLIGKIIAVADSFDAITSFRKYNQNQEGERVKYAKEELKRCSGAQSDRQEAPSGQANQQFDQEVVERFLEINAKPVFTEPKKEDSNTKS